MSKRKSRMNRRRFLTAMGLAGGSLALPSLVNRGGRVARAEGDLPTRVVFYVTQQGRPRQYWNMAMPGIPDGMAGVMDLTSKAESEFSPILRPAWRHRGKLNVVEGLCYITVNEDEYLGAGEDASINRHHISNAGILTCERALQRPDANPTGGAESIDQYIGRRVAVPGRWASRVYGGGGFSFVAPGEQTARASRPGTAFDDVLGAYTPPDEPTGPTRAQQIRAARGSVLDLVAGRYERLAPNVSGDDRRKLERHRDLIRDLELSFGATPTAAGLSCDEPVRPSDAAHRMDQLGKIITMALSCDMTRAITYIAPGLRAEEFGYPTGADVHQDYAHRSGPGDPPEGVEAMREFNTFYAERFARFLDELDSVPEGDGSLLDHTMVIWLMELATGGHAGDRIHAVTAGGANGFLRTGQYVRYAQDLTLPKAFRRDGIIVGPAHTHLLVTAMQAMGLEDDTFGMNEHLLFEGGTAPIRGGLTELHA
jgi:hypothetical protein